MKRSVSDALLLVMLPLLETRTGRIVGNDEKRLAASRDLSKRNEPLTLSLCDE